MNETHEYEDIINLEHHVSKNHQPMSMESRAAQFAPFAALTGHEEAVKETERLTDSKKIIDENYKNLLDEKIMLLQNNIKNFPLISITYFVKDAKKEGGKYNTITGNLKKIDTYERIIMLNDKTKIKFQDIIDITYKERNDE